MVATPYLLCYHKKCSVTWHVCDMTCHVTLWHDMSVTWHVCDMDMTLHPEYSFYWKLIGYPRDAEVPVVGYPKRYVTLQCSDRTPGNLSSQEISHEILCDATCDSISESRGNSMRDFLGFWLTLSGFESKFLLKTDSGVPRMWGRVTLANPYNRLRALAFRKRGGGLWCWDSKTLFIFIWWQCPCGILTECVCVSPCHCIGAWLTAWDCVFARMNRFGTCPLQSRCKLYVYMQDGFSS